MPLIEAAELIKHQNYKTNTPKRFHVQPLHEAAAGALMHHLAELIKAPKNKLDFVYFSVCKGAEPHVDLLDPQVFEARTFVIPLILPTGKSAIVAGGVIMSVELYHVYEFNHEQLHSMELEDTTSGCVVIMVAVKK